MDRLYRCAGCSAVFTRLIQCSCHVFRVYKLQLVPPTTFYLQEGHSRSGLSRKARLHLSTGRHATSAHVHRSLATARQWASGGHVLGPLRRVRTTPAWSLVELMNRPTS